MISERSTCRVCNGNLTPVMDLGRLYPSEFVVDSSQWEPQPLIVVSCKSCGLVQLKHTIDPDTLYRQYWYRSGLNSSMVKALEDIRDGALRRANLKPNDVVVDIGANDGTLRI